MSRSSATLKISSGNSGVRGEVISPTFHEDRNRFKPSLEASTIPRASSGDFDTICCTILFDALPRAIRASSIILTTSLAEPALGAGGKLSKMVVSALGDFNKFCAVLKDFAYCNSSTSFNGILPLVATKSSNTSFKNFATNGLRSISLITFSATGTDNLEAPLAIIGASREARNTSSALPTVGDDIASNILDMTLGDLAILPATSNDLA